MILALLACEAGGPRLPGLLDAGDEAPADSDATVTWYRDVEPIFEQHCTRCHSPGGLGETDLSTYAIAAPMAEIALAWIDAGEMPPPASDPECRDYVGAETLSMPVEARDTIEAWIDAGTPLGDPADAVDVEAASEILQDVDFVVRPAVDHQPAFQSDGNSWHCFVVGGVPDEDYTISALQATIDNRPMVHHIVLRTVYTSELTAVHTADEGFDCAAGQQYAIAKDPIGVWAPGMLPVELPDGIGVPMNGGEPLLLEFHYYNRGDLEPGASDASGYAFRTTEAVETEVTPYVWGPTDFVIPAGDDAYTVTTSAQAPAGYDLTLYTMWPHMHVLGAGYDVRFTNAEGDEDCLIHGEGYSFENQYSYSFVEPYVAEGGTWVDYSCTWNNSTSNQDRINDPPVTTTYGQGSADEMCFFYGLYSLGPMQPKLRVDEVLEGSVSLWTGAADLDLEGDIQAWNYGGVDYDVEGVPFVGVTTGNDYNNRLPDFDGDPDVWTGAEVVAWSTTYEVAPELLRYELQVEAGETYRLQALFFETYYGDQGSRRVDLAVDGVAMVSGLDVSSRSNTAGVVWSGDVVASGDTLVFEVSGSAVGDGSSVLNGLSIERSP